MRIFGKKKNIPKEIKSDITIMTSELQEKLIKLINKCNKFTINMYGLNAQYENYYIQSDLKITTINGIDSQLLIKLAGDDARIIYALMYNRFTLVSEQQAIDRKESSLNTLLNDERI